VRDAAHLTLGRPGRVDDRTTMTEQTLHGQRYDERAQRPTPRRFALRTCRLIESKPARG